MIKIVYFDDESATDYLCIYNGGEIKQTTEEIKKKSLELANDTTTKFMAKLSWLPFFGVSASNETSINAGASKNSLIKSTLSNTVLTDFLKKVEGDNRIEKFHNYTVYPYKNSISYFKMFTPYLEMAKVDDSLPVDIAKMDSAFESGKGYYEMVANSSDEKIKKVFRFNLNAFRNNYGLPDLTKMQLDYYGVNVGKMDLNKLDLIEELNFEDDEQITSVRDIEDNSNRVNDVVEVYDILLAGVNHE